MRRSSVLFLMCSMLSLANLFASEADTFTRRNEALLDSSEIINRKANTAMEESIINANNSGNGCIETELYTELRVYFNNHMKGELIKDIINGTDIPKREITIPDSVYGNWSPWDGIGMGLDMLKKTKLTLATIVRIGDHQVGTDKFEHMSGQGYFYFNDNYLKNKGVLKAVKKGAFKEKTMLGGNKLANGVFSYGDLAANFNGMRMWNHMLQLRDDVLGSDHNIGPYIACENNQWVQVKKIDFRNYIDDSMDEAINCSKFPTQKTADKFTRNIKAMGFKGCPIDQTNLDNLKEKYGAMAKWMINEEGTAAVKYLSEFKNKK